MAPVSIRVVSSFFPSFQSISIFPEPFTLKCMNVFAVVSVTWVMIYHLIFDIFAVFTCICLLHLVLRVLFIKFSYSIF